MLIALVIFCTTLVAAKWTGELDPVTMSREL
jgi:hypothetical protein